jgi:hypothetical protein
MYRGEFSTRPETGPNLTGQLTRMLQSCQSSQDINLRSLTTHDPHLFDHPEITSLVARLSQNPDKNSYPLAILLSQIPFSRLSTEVQNHLNPQYLSCIAEIDPEYTDPENYKWWLCASAEEKLEQALNKQMVVLANHYLLSKFCGRETALCLHTFRTANDVVFVAGNWYSRTDSYSIRSLRAAHDSGFSQVSLPDSSWALMRPLQHNSGTPPQDLLNLARRTALSLPSQLPSTIDGLSRHDIRTSPKYLEVYK